MTSQTGGPILVIALLIAIVGLTMVDSGNSGSTQVLRSDEPRGTTLDVAETDLVELVAGNSSFAFNLYQAIRAEKGNFFYSPYSIAPPV